MNLCTKHKSFNVKSPAKNWLYKLLDDSTFLNHGTSQITVVHTNGIAISDMFQYKNGLQKMQDLTLLKSVSRLSEFHTPKKLPFSQEVWFRV